MIAVTTAEGRNTLPYPDRRPSNGQFHPSLLRISGSFPHEFHRATMQDPNGVIRGIAHDLTDMLYRGNEDGQSRSVIVSGLIEQGGASDGSPETAKFLSLYSSFFKNYRKALLTDEGAIRIGEEDAVPWAFFNQALARDMHMIGNNLYDRQVYGDLYRPAIFFQKVIQKWRNSFEVQSIPSNIMYRLGGARAEAALIEIFRGAEEWPIVEMPSTRIETTTLDVRNKTDLAIWGESGWVLIDSKSAYTKGNTDVEVNYQGGMTDQRWEPLLRKYDQYTSGDRRFTHMTVFMTNRPELNSNQSRNSPSIGWLGEGYSRWFEKDLLSKIKSSVLAAPENLQADSGLVVDFNNQTPTLNSTTSPSLIS